MNKSSIKTAKPIRNIETMWKRLGSEIVTLNRKTHQYHVLNESSALIFELATGENSLEVIAGKLADMFGIDIAQALKDTQETVAGMEKLGLLASPQRARYVKPAVKEVTQKDFNAAIAGGAEIACRSLLGA
jgi:hypothetical protein